MSDDRLTPRDARMYWAAAKIPSDQFLLYCFDHASASAPTAAEIADELIARAASIPDLQVRISPVPFDLDYPSWVLGAVTDVREVSTRRWAEIPAALTRLFPQHVDATVAPWRLHVIPRVDGAPLCDGPATVVVLQLSHAVADGRGAARIARALFGSDDAPSAQLCVERLPKPPASSLLRGFRGVLGLPVALGRTVRRGTAVDGARRELDRRTRAGLLPAAVPGCPPTVLNARPDDSRDVRMLVRRRADFPAGRSVTVCALTAVSVALERYLRSRNEPIPAELCAEVMIAREPRGRERNAFGNVSVPLHPGRDTAQRGALIGASLADARTRASSGLWRVIGAPDESTPAPLAALGVREFDPAIVPERMAGVTVLSSVHRGADDLRLAGGRSVFTAGFPALSPAMSLTHGVHGLGDSVTLSVTSSRTAVPDPDAYAAVLAEAIREVGHS